MTQTITPKPNFTLEESRDMVKAIDKLLELGAVTRCIPTQDQYISNILLAPKPNGGKRFILNLKPLNKFITKTHFKMEDYRTALKLIP